jgi:uncharacterized protein (TIGR02594 family)
MAHPDPVWLAAAQRYIGVTETPGKATTPTIRKWLLNLNAWWNDDETPWCGVFVAEVMRECGIKLPKHWYRARDWLNWGVTLTEPTVGCVVVYERGATSGHVGLVVGRDKTGRLLTLGGNQGNRVSVLPFENWRVLGFRWPPGQLFKHYPLPVLASTRAASGNEA